MKILQQTPDLPDEHSHLESLYRGDFIDAALQPYLDLMGPLFPFLGITGVMGILWVYSDDIKLPTTVGIVLSGVVLAFLPGAMLSIVGGLFVFTIAVALFSVWSGRGIGGGR